MVMVNDTVFDITVFKTEELQLITVKTADKN
jgi:hypothetical protein